MPVFEYSGLTEAGKSVRGVKDAESRKALRVVLRRDGIFLTDVRNADGATVVPSGAAPQVLSGALFHVLLVDPLGVDLQRDRALELVLAPQVQLGSQQIPVEVEVALLIRRRAPGGHYDASRSVGDHVLVFQLRLPAEV